jgi:hypothetical protein
MMAVLHIPFNDQIHHGRMLRQGLRHLEEGFVDLNEVRDVMALMIDGDGSQASQFTYMSTKFGYDGADQTAKNVNAKASWDELNSLLFKLNSNTSQVSVNAALLQVFDKHR